MIIEFNGDFFLQDFGTTIGTKQAHSYANLLVAILKLYMFTYTAICVVLFQIYRCYLWHMDRRCGILAAICIRIESLKFTLEISTTKLLFLDVMVIKKNNGEISTYLLRKSTIYIIVRYRTIQF